MAICTVAQLKQQLNLTDDLGTADDELLQRKLAAAQNHVERLIGYKIEDTYGGTDQLEIPPSLIEGVLQLAAHWYENREASTVGVQGFALPFGVLDIVAEYRSWSFDG